jgi:uncharacterized protein (DUF169 family)
MVSLRDLNIFGEEIERRLQLRTSPIAVKVLQREDDIPEGALRPKRDRGYHLAQCQAFAMSRRERVTVAMLKEDQWCYLPVIAFGLSEPPDFFLNGNTFLRSTVGDPTTARDLAEAFPRLKCGKNIGILSAPLNGASFVPDVVTVYCNTNQLRCLLSAVKYKDGYLAQSTLDPGGACVQSMVPVLQKGECQVAVPCGGDRAHALAQDDEMIFSVPIDKLGDLVDGLRVMDDAGRGYTRFAPAMRPDYRLPGLYVKVGAMVGLEMEPE